MADGNGYVNRGPDERVDGPVGKVLGGTQRLLSFQSPTPPKVAKVPLKDGGHIAVAWPPFLSVFVARGDGRYRSFRLGWRWDANWGDGNNPNEPQVERPGGYVADVIVKQSIDNVVLP
jgi:hypothetical protein